MQLMAAVHASPEGFAAGHFAVAVRASHGYTIAGIAGRCQRLNTGPIDSRAAVIRNPPAVVVSADLRTRLHIGLAES